ncbi:hypothetical protein WA158_000194 [Blastocystis sp. Blastoise]
MKSFIVFIALCCLATLVQSTCLEGEFEMVIKKKFGGYPTEETLNVYKGPISDGVIIKTYKGISGDEDKIYSWTVCTTSVLHNVEMVDSYGDGWGNSAKESSVWFYIDEIPVFSCTLAYQSGTLNKLKVVSFTPAIAKPYSSSWSYTDAAQADATWSTTSGASGWQSGNTLSLPARTSTTRYYKTTITMPSQETYGTLALKIKGNYGCIIYANGQEAFRYNLPQGAVTSTTNAIAISTNDILTFVSKNSLQGASTIALGIEAHSAATDTTSTDSFDCQIVFEATAYLDRSPDVIHISGGSGVCDPVGTSCSALFINNVGTFYSTSTWSQGTNFVYTFPAGHYEYVNYYSLRSYSATSYGDPKSWKVYGSNDGTNWSVIDVRMGVTFASRSLTQYFSIGSNTKAFNMIKLEILESSLSSLGFAGFRFYRRTTDVVLPGLHFTVSNVIGQANMETISTEVSSSGYYNFTISPPLPTGLTMNSAGAISGSSSAIYTGTHTITAINGLTEQQDSTTITISFTSCQQPDQAPMSISKVSSSSPSYESWKIYDSQGNLLYSSGANASGTTVKKMCLPAGVLKFRLDSTSSDGWYTSSYLLLNFLIEGQLIKYTQLTLNQGYYKEFYVDTKVIGSSSFGTWKYKQGPTIPATWYTSNYVDTDFQLLPVLTTATPSTHHNLALRTTFTIDNKANHAGILFTLRARAGIIIYVNGVELYRKNLASGTDMGSLAPTSGSSSLNTYSITLSMTPFVVGVNTIAVGLVNLATTSVPTIDSIVFFNYLGQHASEVSRYWSLSYSTSYSTNTAYLFDYNYRNNWYGTPTYKNPSYISVNFGSYRAEYFNKYCLTSSSTTYAYDPSDWQIWASMTGSTNDWTSVHNVTNAYFSDRKETRCFYMPDNNKAWQYYKVIFTENALPTSTSYKYYASELSFLIDDLDTVVIPELSITPNVIHGIKGIEFPTVTPSSSVYTNFRITPPLTLPLELDTTTGTIRGIPTTILPSQVYTITATNHLGQDKTTTLTMSVEYCQPPNVLFNIKIKGDSYGGEQGYILKDINGNIIDSRVGVMSNTQNYFPKCLPSDLYSISLTDTAKDGWSSGYMEIVLDNNDIIFRGSLGPKESLKTFPVSIGYVINPLLDSWKYNHPSAALSSTWSSDTFNDANWQNALPTDIPQATTITQYYRKTFSITDTTRYASVEISIKTKVGFVAYLNGVEIYKRNMGVAAVTFTTSCKEKSTELKSYGFTGRMENMNMKNGNNVLAIEIHQYKTGYEQEFNVGLSVISDSAWRLIDGTVTATLSDSDLENLVDNSIYSVFTAGPSCVGTYILYTYNNDRREYISGYSLTSASNCNNRHPSGWLLEASNDKKIWEPLHKTEGVFFTSYYQQLNFTFYNEKSYNMYRFTVTECDNPALTGSESDSTCLYTGSTSERGFQLSDISFYSKKVTASCIAQNGYPAAVENQMAVKKCADYYTGTIIATCISGKFSNEAISCQVDTPSRIYYSNRFISITQGDSFEITPVVHAAEYTCSISPAFMPSLGISFDTKTARIYGTPSQVLANSEYEVTCTNAAGSVSAQVFITVNEKSYTTMIALIVLAIVVVIIILVLVLCIINRSKSRSKTGHKKLDTKASSKKSSRRASETTSSKQVKV